MSLATASRTCIDADVVNYRLREAGETLLALPKGDWSLLLDTASLEVVRTALEIYGWTAQHRIQPALPSMAKIARMDEALEWITLIPQERDVLRRVVGARALVHPITDRHLFSWQRLANVLGADHKAIQDRPRHKRFRVYWH
jgi:hypothetical protein